jgi:gliding motility-associated-like protein
MKFRLLLSFFIAFLPVALFAQVTGIEQDCINALPLCQTIQHQPTTYSGSGPNDNEIPSTSCLAANKENNSVWYFFTLSSSGILEFRIIPDGNDDYDFALYNITGVSCADIPTGVAPEVRCSYAVTTGIPTGIATGGTGTSAPPNGPALLAPLNVTIGETFALMVDNFNGQNAQGYTIDFTGSTGFVRDTVKPRVEPIAALPPCAATSQLTVTFSEPVKCTSVAANGSDFAIINGPSVISVTAANTNCTGTYTNSVVLTLSPPIEVGGNYDLQVKVGSDGNSVLDKCDLPVDPVLKPFFQEAVLNGDFTYAFGPACNVDTLKLYNTTQPHANITTTTWDFGDATTGSGIDSIYHVYAAPGTYTVTMTVNSVDCQDIVVKTITVGHTFLLDFTMDPIDPCINEIVTYTVTNPGPGQFIWDFGDSQISGTNPATHAYADSGSFTVTLTATFPTLNCDTVVTKPIFVSPLAEAIFGMNAAVVCEETAITFLDSSIGHPTTWHWDFGTGDTSAQQNPTYTFPTTGSNTTYNVELTINNGCNPDDVTHTVEVRVLPIFNLGNDTIFCKPDSILLTAYSPADSILWSTGETTESIYFSQIPDEVRATAILNGCSYTDAILIDEQEDGCIELHLPTAFTPGGGKANAYFRLVDPERIGSVSIKIFNRWGKMVFSSTKTNFAWDGEYNGEQVPMGVYTWYIEATGLSGQNAFAKGTVTVVR